MDALDNELVELAKETSNIAMVTHAGLVALLTAMRRSGALDCEVFAKELKHLAAGPLEGQLSRSETGQNAMQALLNIAGEQD
ncbi:hypothetical protein NJC40_03435 [Pseudomonas sp. 21LCFQ02]|uniref:hypothetical protein n=1 Tax=Pseudomonas sp. 21LCFQ02 TaxID=2957505 RepID=UPI00209AD6D2|nr:hypothetical protein [Pseudomonas sp. 21LCFQ02]MCO8166830.1 hypothetical protein [Pseudomonas sp. 21LCFQ02]